MIDIEKFICSLIYRSSGFCVIKVIDIINALHSQGLEYKDGKIVRVNPQPEESEYDGDEKIRKDLITFLDDVWHLGKNANLDKWGKADCSDWIDWIEKQGNLVKHYEEKLDKCACDNFNKGYKAALEKQGEQKPADKIEPKFKVGDWVVYKGDICQIVKREEGCNKLVTIFGIEKEPVNERNLSTARLWTIQDAKAGDVLADNCLMVLFSKFAEPAYREHIIAYAGIDSTCKLQITDGIWILKNPRPATKEQRDLLFQKMKETGYEWDEDKLELKKIEHNLVEKYKDWYDFIRWFVKQRTDKYTHIPSNDDIHKWGDNILNHARKVLEQNTAWSKEDEEIINKISIAIAAIYSCSTAAKVEKWLKLLKERYTWKPSDEQIEALDDFIYAKYPNTEKHGAAVKSLYQDLKKLMEE